MFLFLFFFTKIKEQVRPQDSQLFLLTENESMYIPIIVF
jgi:hypothetical protein